MASKGNKIESWEPNPFTPAPNSNAMNASSMTSPEAQAARAKSAEVMAALKKGDQGEADRVMGRKKEWDSLLPGMGALKGRLFGGKRGKGEGKELGKGGAEGMVGEEGRGRSVQEGTEEVVRK